jgi:lipid-A-disaccharide synthase
MKYYIVAGEASGDLHASNLMKCIVKHDSHAEFRYYGGELMKKAGGTLVRHYRDMAVMGIWEVITKYGKIKNYIKECKADIKKYKPDVIILVDYAGFNLRIAKFASELKIRVFYYISPKLWAWGSWRVKKIRKYVDRMFAILPFEVDFYRNHNCTAEYYGNPVVDSVFNYRKKNPDFRSFITTNALIDKPIIALLAGSRKQEIHLCLPEMLSIIKHYPEYQFVIAGAPSIPADFYKPYIDNENVYLLYDQTYEILAHASAAVVTSGTATLETALFKVPQVVIYKTSTFTYYAGRLLVDIEFFSLVNLILGFEAVKELLQFNLADKIKNELDRILFDQPYREKMLGHYNELLHKVGNPGVSDRVAERMIELLTN